MAVPSPSVELRTDPPTESQHLRVAAHLEALLGSAAFSGSHRSQEFLRYIVKETLEGRGPAIKERNIATDVFGRGEDFDTQTESVVRVSAVEVRKRLSQAYKNGAAEDVRIELPVGSYHPIFRFSAGLPASPSTKRWGRPWVLAALAMGVPLLGLLSWLGLRRPSAVEQLWAPFAERNRPVLIALPSPRVYELRRPEKWLPLEPGKTVPASALIEKENYYIGVGAGFGAARFAEQLALRRQSFFVKIGKEVSFADLRHSPTILMGSYSSPLSLEMHRKLRFLFAEGETRSIVDSLSPGRRWAAAQNGQEGYSLVTRLLQSESGDLLLIVAGISARDTEAAVAFLTRTEDFSRFAAAAPQDWPRKNFQVVLHNSIHGNSPGRPEIAAWHLW
jgi:hypothetical protein